MSDFRSALRAQLIAAGERELTRPERRWRRRVGGGNGVAAGGSGARRRPFAGGAGIGGRRLTGALASGAAMLIVLAVAGALIVALGHGAAQQRQRHAAAAPHPDAAWSLTPCSYIPPAQRRERPETSAPSDRRLTAVLGVLRRPANTADRGPGARCAASVATAGAVVHTNDVRAVGRGVLGGSLYLVPVSGIGNGPAVGIRPGIPSERGDEPGVCLIPVGYPGTMGGSGGCVALSAIEHGHGYSFGSAEIVNAPAEQEMLAAAHVPASLRSGSIVAGIYPDGVADLLVRYHGEPPFRVPVRDNVAVFHTRHSAPVAVHARVTLLDARGRAIRP